MKIGLSITGLVAVLIIGILVLSVWGLIIAFQSHILTGFLILIIEPAPLAIGILDGVFDVGVTDAITKFIKGI